ncbi:MAG: hypothetical protein J6D53_13520 [Blautia sp.]|nr:hypothetical protein [Blautia sp.]
MINKKCSLGKKAYAARRIAAILMTGTMAGAVAMGTPGLVQEVSAGYSANADYIFEYLTKRLGYSEAAACGIMANIRCESTFNPQAYNAGGGSYGLCQWTGGRYGRLRSWCGSNGYDYKTIDGQLAYLQYELQTYYRSVEDYLRSVENNSDGAYKAGQYYCYHFEAPASRGSVSVYRGGLASDTFWSAYRPAEWYEENEKWRYIKNDGSYHTSWLTVDNKTYYLDENGYRVTGWKTIDGKRYYFGADGAMASGWVKVDGKDYYFEEGGALVTGLVMKGEDWYMLDQSGQIQASAAMKDFAQTWLAAADIKGDDSSTASASEDNNGSTTAASNQADESGKTETAAADTNTVSGPLASAGHEADLTTPSGKETESVKGLELLAENAREDIAPELESTHEQASEQASAASSVSQMDVLKTAAAAIESSSESGSVSTDSTLTAQKEKEDESAQADQVNTAAASVQVEEPVASAEIPEKANEEDAGSSETAEQAEEETNSDETSRQEEEEASSVETSKEAKEAEEEEANSDETSNVAEEDEESPQKTDSEIEDAGSDFTAAEAMRIAAEVLDEGMDEEEDSGKPYIIYEPQAEDVADQDSDKEAEAQTDEESTEPAAEITLSDSIPMVTLDELDDLVKLLDEKDILHAVSKDGKDITKDVKADYEQIDSSENNYKVIFSVTYDGQTVTYESTAYVTK